MKSKIILLFLYCINLSIQAMTDETKILSTIPINPFKNYALQKSFTYITKDIYFESEADLVGGSSEGKVIALHVNNKTIKLDQNSAPEINSQVDPRHPTVLYNLKNDTLRYKINKKEEQKDLHIIVNLNTLEIKNFNRSNISFINIKKQLSIVNPITSNYYKINEEKLNLPIIGLLFPATFLIQYVYIPCFSNGTPLKWRIFTVKNGITAINAIFISFIIYLNITKKL